MEPRVIEHATSPTLTGLCIGYELGAWRNSDFARHLINWIPDFVLTHRERESLGLGNAVELVRQAAAKIYKSKKFDRRGEFGELLLHAAVRQVFGSLPAISKIYYKSSNNETVKGFDAVHVVASNDGLELWLGEAKFYDDIKAAIRDVVIELQVHTERDYLRDEFVLIAGKIEDEWPHAEKLRRLIAPETSLDEIFRRVCIPVLLTYDSPCVSAHTECSEGYCDAFRTEVLKHFEDFSGRSLPPLAIHLFLIPLEEKRKLVAELDSRLKSMQAI